MSLYNLSDDVNGVSQKIRAAIKAKLMELGVCVEDELPDYIMVMIANKKTKDQMTEDLNLFLGNNTEKFTSWLSDLLQRLQSVTSDVNFSNKRDVSDSKVTEEKTVYKVSTSNFIMDSSAEKNNETKSKCQVTQPKPKSTYIQQDVVMKGNETIGTTTSEQEDVLALKAELEDDLFEEELNQETAVNKKKQAVPDIKSSVRSQQDTSRRRKIVRVKPATQEIKRRGPVSTVGAIMHRPVEPVEDQEYDPNNPAIGKVASIVKVSERKSSVPVERQANKNLLFRAMREAQLSVAEKPSLRKPGSVMQVEPFIESNRNAQIMQHQEKELFKEHNVEMKIENNLSPTEEIGFTPTEEVLESYPEVNIITGNLNTEISKFPAKDRIILKPTKHKKITFESQGDFKEQSISPNPSFIVTLDGLDESNFQNAGRKRSYPQTQISSLVNEELLEEDQVEAMDEDSDSYEYSTDEKKTKLPERCKFWPTCKNADSCEFHHPNTSCKLFPNCKFGDKCLYIHPNCKYDSKCTKEDCPFTHASRRIISTSSSTPSVNTSTSEVMCRFFPNCTKPNCPFKHVKPCRWGFGCKRSDCSFFHPSLPTPEQLKWTAGDKQEIAVLENN